MSSVLGGSEHSADQWRRGPWHKVQALLRPPPQAPQVLGDPLAPPGHVHLRTDPALRAAAPGGRVEVGELPHTHPGCVRGQKKPKHVFFLSGTIWGSDTSRPTLWKYFKMTERPCSTFTSRSVVHVCQHLLTGVFQVFTLCQGLFLYISVAFLSRPNYRNPRFTTCTPACIAVLQKTVKASFASLVRGAAGLLKNVLVRVGP